MKLRLLSFILLLCSVFVSRAQQNKEIARLVNQKKQSGADFKPYSPLRENGSQTALRQEAARGLNKFSLFDIDQNQLRAIVNDKPEAVAMKLATGAEGDFDLELVKVNLFAPDFKVTTSDNQTFRGYDNQVHYRGVVKGVERSITAISISGDQVTGIISLPNKGNFVLGAMDGLNPDKQHVLYNDQDLKTKPAFDCKTPEDNSFRYTHEQLFGNPTARGQGASCVRIYVETDYNIFVNRGSVANVATFITALFNQSAMLYQNEGVFTVLSQIAVWTSASPYNPTNTSTLLASFQSFRNVFNGDLGQLVGFYNIGGLAAGFTGLCNTNRDFDQCVSGLTGPTFSNVPTFSFNVEVFTHEMGHLMGSRHTHACVWNGTCTAIDGCAGYTEPGCAPSCPLGPIPAGGGTIMSYCHVQPVGINFTLGFGPQPSNVIRNRIFAAPCLNACAPQPAVDLFIQDKPSDNGTEPNPDPTGEFWVSQDIWVRNLNDGGTVHQNPRGGFVNYVYVRVRNRGSLPSFTMPNVRLRTYWAKASGSLSWLSPWNGGVTGCTPPASMGSPIGTTQIPSIAANGSVVLAFAWNAPVPASYSCFGADRFHFCLLARVETTTYSPFGMTFPETTNLWQNVKNNNNEAWKNVSVSNPNGTFTRMRSSNLANSLDDGEVGEVGFAISPDDLKEQGVQAFNLDFTFEQKREIAGDITLDNGGEAGEDTQVGNDLTANDDIDIASDTLEPSPLPGVTIFKDPAAIPYRPININHHIWEFAYVDIDLGKNLFTGWSKTGLDFKILDETAPSGVRWVRLLNPKSSLDKIVARTKDIEVVKVRITQFKAAPEDETEFDFDVTLTNYSDKRERIGGETFFVKLGTVDRSKTISSARSLGNVAATAEETVFIPSNSSKRVDVVAVEPADQYEATIFDMSGKLVRRKAFTGKTSIETNGLSRGMYLASLVNLRTKAVTKHKMFLE